MELIQSLKDIQKLEIDMLQEIDIFCRENSLIYYLAGGTLLGAVRHKGMIPWDNDIDISMPRKDYKIFLKTWNSKCRKNYYKTRVFGENNYYLPFAKIEDKRTLLKQNNSLDAAKIGVFIDIFPIDAYGEDLEVGKKVLSTIENTCGRITRSGAAFENKSIKENMKQLFWKIYYNVVGQEKAYNLVQQPLKNFDWDSSKYIASTFGLRREKELIEKKYFETTIELEFEGRQYLAPIGFDAYLKKMYGDYMKLPPEEKRVTPHEFDTYWLGEGDKK